MATRQWCIEGKKEKKRKASGQAGLSSGGNRGWINRWKEQECTQGSKEGSKPCRVRTNVKGVFGRKFTGNAKKGRRVFKDTEVVGEDVWDCIKGGAKQFTEGRV